MYGADLDPTMLELAAEVLCDGDSDELETTRSRLRPIDTLLTPVWPSGEFGQKPWSALFPEVFDRGGFDLVVTNPPWEKVRANDREFFGQYSSGFGRRPRGERDRLRAELLAQPEIATAYGEYVARIEALKRAARRDFETSGAGGDLDTYKLAVERTLELTRPGGLVAVVVPHGLLGDWGARRLRRWLLERHSILEVIRLETGRDLFPEIHANLGVVLLVVRKQPAPESSTIAVSRPVRRVQTLESPTMSALPVTLVRRATSHLAIPLVDDARDIEFLERCLRFPSLGEWPDEIFRPRREVDMTSDRDAFRGVGDGLPLLEGKHLGPFRIWPERRRYDVDPARARHAGRGRMAWRAVADRAMRRRLVAAWIPPGVALGNSAVFSVPEGREAHVSLLWLLAWMNSRIAEAQLRLLCANNNINIFHVQSCRVPMPWRDRSARHLLELTAGLVLAGSKGLELPEALHRLATPLPDRSERRRAIDAIDGFWRRAYGLSDPVWRTAVRDRTASVADWPEHAL